MRLVDSPDNVRGRRGIRPFALGLTAGIFAVGVACSSDSDSGKNRNLAIGGSGGEGAGGREGVVFGNVDPDSGVEGGTSLGSRDKKDCVSEIARAETIPVDIYVMFDQSGTMINPAGDGTRLDAVRGAAVDFFNDPASTGLGLGIGYFGHLPLGETSCDPADYATPAVPIASLPDGTSALISSLNGIEPVGETPTGAAVRGACSYAQSFKEQNPTHYVVILLVTDGIPQAPVTSRQYLVADTPEVDADAGADGGTTDASTTYRFVDAAGFCNPTLADAVTATGDCATGETPIPTYVLGVGPELENLNQIAAAGGTEQAYLIEGSDVAAEVLEAFSTIRGDALIPCEFQIPEPVDVEDTIDFDTVNVRYIAGDGVEKELFNVVDAAGCTGEGGPKDGWYYDDPAAPTRILLCASTCSQVTADTGGQVDYTLGCEQTRVIR